MRAVISMINDFSDYMNGTLTFLNSNCYFSFDGKTLEIYCVNGEARTILWEKLTDGSCVSAKKEIPSNRLEGHSFDLNADVVFYIDSKGYGYHGSIDAEKVILKINVLKYITIKSKICDKNILVFSSKQFHKFLYLFPQYNLTLRHEDKIADITYKSVVSSDKAEFTFKGKKFVAYPCPTIKTQGNKFDFIPEIHIVCDEALEETEMLSLVEILYKIISFLFMRVNIIPDSIYCSNNLQHNIFYRKATDYIEEKEDVNSIRKYGFIRWNTVCKNFQKIIDDFIDGNVDTKHLGNSSESRKWIDFKKVSTISSFFESTYALIYGDKPNHRTSTQKNIDAIIETLLPLKDKGNNRKMGDTIDYLIKQLDHVSLETKIQKVLNEYDGYLCAIKKEFGLENNSVTEIAGICAQTRNWTDHGDKRAEINPFIASCFAYLTCATYAMYLKRWRIDDKFIANALLELYMV